MASYPNFKLKMTKLGCQRSQIKNFQKSFFSLKSLWELMKEISRSLLFSFQETKCAQTLCDASDCFHTLLRLQRMIRKQKKKKKQNFTTKYYTPKIWSLHIILITTQKVLFYTFNSLCFKHFCVVVLHLYSNWHVKDLAMTYNHICG